VDPKERTTYKSTTQLGFHLRIRMRRCLDDPSAPSSNPSPCTVCRPEGAVKPNLTPVVEPPEKLLCCHRGRRRPCAPTVLARTTPLGFRLRVRPRCCLNPMIHRRPLLIRHRAQPVAPKALSSLIPHQWWSRLRSCCAAITVRDATVPPLSWHAPRH
jgi:hypothetical protein